MSWRVLYIEESDKLSLYLDNIKVIKNDEEILVPIKDIHSLIVDNYKILLSVHLLNALSHANVNVVLCGVDHLPQTIFFPLFGNSNAAASLKKQLKWDGLRKKILHQKIVRRKVKHQKELLMAVDKHNPEIEILSKYEKEVELGDETNREGLAAKQYFKGLFGDEFKRFENDIINAGLNYGYAILRSQISKTLVSKGLNTTIGIFHKNPTNNFNLSDDIIEPFRPIIDYWVYKNLMEEEIFLRDHRLELINQTTKDVYFKNTRQTIFNAISMYVDSILTFLDTGDVDKLFHPEIKYDEL